jgi:hypothetical protein
MQKIVVMMLAAAVGVVAAAPAVRAAPLVPGAAPIAVPVFATAEGGTVLMDTGAMPYAFGLVNTGTIEEIVVKDTGVATTNPFGLGTLSFIYQVHVTGGQIARVSGTNYGFPPAFFTDVIQAPPIAPFILGGIKAASSADRAADGSVVGFNFVPAILPDGGTVDTTFELTVRTNATSFIPGFIGLIDGGGVTMVGYAPAPEPASVIMLGFGVAGMLGYGWKRRKAT